MENKDSTSMFQLLKHIREEMPDVKKEKKEKTNFKWSSGVKAICTLHFKNPKTHI